MQFQSQLSEQHTLNDWKISELRKGKQQADCDGRFQETKANIANRKMQLRINSIDQKISPKNLKSFLPSPSTITHQQLSPKTKHQKHLVDTFGKDHAAEDFLQIGDGLGLDSVTEVLQLLLPPVQFLLNPPLPLAAAVRPWPLHRNPPRRRPGNLQNFGPLIFDPWLHSPLQRLHLPMQNL